MSRILQFSPWGKESAAKWDWVKQPQDLCEKEGFDEDAQRLAHLFSYLKWSEIYRSNMGEERMEERKVANGFLTKYYRLARGEEIRPGREAEDVAYAERALKASNEEIRRRKELVAGA